MELLAASDFQSSDRATAASLRCKPVANPANLSDGCHGLGITYFPDYNEPVSNVGGLSALRPAEIKIRSILSARSAEYKLTCPLFVAGGIPWSTPSI